MIAQYYGGGYFEEVKQSVKTGMFMAVVLGAIMSVFGYILTPWLLSLLNVPADIIDYSITYMRVYFCGSIPVLIYNVGSSILRATGDSKRPLFFLIVACITNVTLDLLFVLAFHLEVFGVALATIISQLISAILTLLVLNRTDDCYHFSLKDIGFDGVFLDRIRYPSAVMGFESLFGCQCKECLSNRHCS